VPKYGWLYQSPPKSRQEAQGGVTGMAELDLLKDCGIDFLYVVIDRKDVENLYLDIAFNSLRRLLQDRQTVVSFRARLDIAFAGYDNDVRELHEIDEVRNFLSLLDKKFPFWFYFINLHNGTLALILLSLCQYSKRLDGLFIIDRDDQERFFVEHGSAVTWLFDAYGLDEKEYEALTTQIAKYLERRKHPSVTH
jgi:hypothetical protein